MPVMLPRRRPTGKLPARHDPRMPRFADHVHKASLPPVPTSINWYAAIGFWPMLFNDQVGDCTVAAAGHCVQQFSTYAGTPSVMTEEEAVTTYSLVGGFNPNAALDATGNNPTDQGLYMMGPGGLIEHWKNAGIPMGGKLDKLTSAVQVAIHDPDEWKQAIQLFGGLLTGFRVPESLVAEQAIPYVWTDASGPSAGGHEVWVDGLIEVAGTKLYELVSWGTRYRATEEFFLATVDELIAVADPASMNARGVDGAGVSWETIVAGIEQFRSVS